MPSAKGDGKKGKKQGGGGGKKKQVKKETGLSISVKKSEDFARWYSEVIVCSEMIDYYSVAGCYILRPWAFNIWEHIQGFLDGEIKARGVKNCYFPLFVTPEALEQEKDHIEDFAPEVAWVTRSGETDLEKPLAIRPTSETIMYPAVKKWIRSHRDLPMRLNQWTNVVRWEFKHPTPFLRTREFLWQEGHSAFATRAEADEEVLEILDLYARVYEELLAVPVIKGRKSEKEKFAGGHYTTTVEALIPATGRAIQGATSHCLGQNFAKMYDIRFSDKEGSKQMVWQNSWGLTTRTIGVMVMVHGDDKGLRLPPRIAPVQVVIVPISKSDDSEETKKAVRESAAAVCDSLHAAGVRTELDDRTDRAPGWKYNHWEQKGVPLRVEVGPKDLAKNSCMVVRRDGRGKLSVAVDGGLPARLQALLEEVQSTMLAEARAERDSRMTVVTKWEDFVPALDAGNLVLAPWCEDVRSEEWVKEQTKATGAEEEAPGTETEADKGPASGAGAGDAPAAKLSGSAKTLCIPFDQPPMAKGMKCFTGFEGKEATAWTLWGRSY